MTAFIGVRISWLIVARNALFASVAASAASPASWSSVMSWYMLTDRRCSPATVTGAAHELDVHERAVLAGPTRERAEVRLRPSLRRTASSRTAGPWPRGRRYAADRLARAVSEQPLGGRVPRSHEAVIVGHDDRDGADLDEECVVGPCGLPLGVRGDELGGPLRHAVLEDPVVGLDLLVQASVLDRRSDEVADGQQEPPGDRIDRPPARAVVGREQADPAALGDHRHRDVGARPEGSGQLPHRGLADGVRVDDARRLVCPEGGGEPRDGVVNRQLEGRDHPRVRLAAADAPAASQNPPVFVRQEDEGPLEVEIRDHGLKAALEEVVEIAGRRECQADLAERAELRDPVLEPFVRTLQVDVGVGPVGVFRLGGVALLEEHPGRLLPLLGEPTGPRSLPQDDWWECGTRRDCQPDGAWQTAQGGDEHGGRPQQPERDRRHGSPRPLLPGELPLAVLGALALALHLANRGQRQTGDDVRDGGEAALVAPARVDDVGESMRLWDVVGCAATVQPHDGTAGTRADRLEAIANDPAGQPGRGRIDRLQPEGADQPDEALGDAPRSGREDEIGIARQVPGRVGEEQPELGRVVVAVVEQVFPREVVVLIRDRGIEPLDELVDNSVPGLLAALRALRVRQAVRRLPAGPDHDLVPEGLQDTEDGAVAATHDRVAELVDPERLADHPLEVEVADAPAESLVLRWQRLRGRGRDRHVRPITGPDGTRDFVGSVASLDMRAVGSPGTN